MLSKKHNELTVLSTLLHSSLAESKMQQQVMALQDLRIAQLQKKIACVDDSIAAFQSL